MTVEWLNYHHLLYFWTVIREGSIAKAAEELSLAPPTVHAQLRSLEDQLGEKLLVKKGRKLTPTEAGQMVYGYAEEIFSLGRELTAAVKQHQSASDRPVRFNVGVVDSVPKIVAKELLMPALRMSSPLHLVVKEGKLDDLVAELATHRLDLVLADLPYNAPSAIRIFHHALGECGITFFAAPPLAEKLREGFPQSLDGAPALLPTENTAMRRTVEGWFDKIGVQPQILAEFEDTALLKVFGSDAQGFFALPTVAVEEIAASHGVEVIGSTEECRERFIAISAERRLKHPAVVEISRLARNDLFGS